MPGHEFLFALELSDGPQFDGMLRELTNAVLSHVGYEAAAIEELQGVLRGALAAGTTKGHTRCDIQFRAESGELQIEVAYAGAAGWRTKRPLP